MAFNINLSDLRSSKGLLSAGTIGAALAVGLVMQSLDAGPTLGGRAPQTLEVTDITLTSSVAPARLHPGVRGAQDPVPASQIVTTPEARVETPVEPCDITLEAAPAAAAMVALSLHAPCQADAGFVLHHNGMMFSARTDSSGAAHLTVPALAQNAVFIASFDGGGSAVARQAVPDLERFDRAVVQWRGHAALGLHAREDEAPYFAEGHIHAGASGSVAGLELGEHGVMHVFGEATGPDALFAEVYTYPHAKQGVVALSVEVEVVETNCGKSVEAQTLQVSGGTLDIRDVMLSIPACDALGDFLVLKNLLQDMTLAAR